MSKGLSKRSETVTASAQVKNTDITQVKAPLSIEVQNSKESKNESKLGVKKIITSPKNRSKESSPKNAKAGSRPTTNRAGTMPIKSPKAES